MDKTTSKGRPAGDRRLSFLLDTDTCSAYIKGNKLVFQRFLQYGGQLHASTVTLAELLTWALRAKAPPSRLQDVRDLLRLVIILDVNQDVAWKFGELRATLLDAGTDVPDLDLVNASVASVHSFTMVTHNTADYKRVPGLLHADWMVP
jgi:tRNA(fMet)-specific endonuclease VapC